MKLSSLILLIFAIILSACNNRSDIADALSRADAIICEQPDSALAILLAVDTTDISDDMRAHYALLISKSKTSFPIEYQKLKLERQQAEAQRAKTTFLFVAIFSLLVFVFLIFMIRQLRNRLKAKSAQQAASNMSLITLEQEIEAIQIDNIRLKSELQKLFKSSFCLLNMLCQIWWDSSINNKISFNKRAIETLQELHTPEMQQRLIRLINQYCDNWFDNFKSDFPNLTDSQYQLATYLFVGLSTESIAIIMEKSTPNAVFCTKKRLRHYIYKYSDCNIANKYIIDLNLKPNS